MLVHLRDIPIVMETLPVHTAINTARPLELLLRTPIVTEIRLLLIEIVMVTQSVLRQLIPIRMVTPQQLIVIDMVTPQEQTGATRTVMAILQQPIPILMVKEEGRQTHTLIATGTPPLPIGTPTGKASALLQAILIRLGILLRSNVAMMRTPQSGHGNQLALNRGSSYEPILSAS